MPCWLVRTLPVRACSPFVLFGWSRPGAACSASPSAAARVGAGGDYVSGTFGLEPVPGDIAGFRALSMAIHLRPSVFGGHAGGARPGERI